MSWGGLETCCGWSRDLGSLRVRLEIAGECLVGSLARDLLVVSVTWRSIAGWRVSAYEMACPRRLGR